MQLNIICVTLRFIHTYRLLMNDSRKENKTANKEKKLHKLLFAVRLSLHEMMNYRGILISRTTKGKGQGGGGCYSFTLSEANLRESFWCKLSGGLRNREFHCSVTSTGPSSHTASIPIFTFIEVCT